MWEADRLGRPRFKVLEIFSCARDGLNGGVPSFTLRKNGEQHLLGSLDGLLIAAVRRYQDICFPQWEQNDSPA